MNRPQRLRLFEVSVEAFRYLFEDGEVTKVTDGVPFDGDIVNHGYDHESGLFYIVMEHPEFDLVREGEAIPTDTVEVTTLDPAEVEV
jgi:hypothetical protein